MTEVVQATLPLKRWQGDKAVYHLVTFSGPQAETLAGHALLHRLEFGRARGFGSIKVMARIGDTSWKTSVFPQNKQSEWVLLVSRKIMRAENLAPSDEFTVEVTPI